MIESIGISGLDFAIVDMEHTTANPSNLYHLVLAAERRKLKLVVRIPEKNEIYFKWCKDLGINDIQIPHVTCSEDVSNSINYSMFSPIGNRGLCRFVRASDFSNKNVEDYINHSNKNCKMTLQIEGLNGFNNLDDILEKVNSSCRIFIGPYDLSASLGIPGQIWHLNVQEKMIKIIEKCKQKNVEVGTFTDSIDGITKWKNLGIDFIEYASDLNLFIEKAKEIKTHCN